MLKKSMGRFYFWLTICGFFWLMSYFLVLNDNQQIEEKQLASLNEGKYTETFETPESCGKDRVYHLKAMNDLKKVLTPAKSNYSSVRGGPPRQCVTYVMDSMNKILTNKNIAQCPQENMEPIRGVVSENPAENRINPCLTQNYVDVVYNSFVDVMDCLNIPSKELLPKLYNESGMHFNTLGPDADAGVGQMTRQAMMEVFINYDGDPVNPMALDFYLNEVKKSSKASCQRIAGLEKFLRLNPPKGQKICNLNEAKAESALPEDQRKCFLAWSGKNRCNMVVTPSNPLRNIFYTAIFYRSMLKNAVGISYERGGEDIVTQKDGSKPNLSEGTEYRGYFETLKINQRLEELGFSDFNREAFKSMFVSFGFNGGIDKGAILFDIYLKARQEAGLKLSAQDFDFRNTTKNSRWGTLVSFASLYKAMKANPDDEQRYLKVLDLMREARMDDQAFSDLYHEIKKTVVKDPEVVDFKSFATKYQKERLRLLKLVLDDAYQLSLPEFFVIGHAAYTDKSGGGLGGAPGYLNFIMRKQIELENIFGENLCTSPDYLKF